MSNYEMLLRNTEAYPNIKCLHNGIWNKETNLEILDFGGGGWAFTTRESKNTVEKNIKAISINQIIKEFSLRKIDILKIDIEGSEKEMFEMNFEDWLAITKVIIVELHDRYRPGCAKSFFKALVSYDFSLGHKGDNLICVLEHDNNFT